MKAPTPPRPREGVVRAACLLEVGALPYVFVWSNNTGAYEAGEDRFVRYGCPGSSDILGMVSLLDRPQVARFFALETKATHPPLCPCKTCVRQRGWGLKVASIGGFYAVARDPARARAAVEAARRGEPGPWMT